MNQHFEYQLVVATFLGFILPCLTNAFLWTPGSWPPQNRVPVSLRNATTDPSNITIFIGNRINTTAGVIDNGTIISGFNINLNRWNGHLNLTVIRNKTDVLLTKENDHPTIVQIIYGRGSSEDSNDTATNSELVNTQSTDNKVDTQQKRKKRDIVNSGISISIPGYSSKVQNVSLLSLPIPKLNGSFVSLNNSLIPLPSSISNAILNAFDTGNIQRNATPATIAEFGSVGSAFQQPWEFLKLLVERRLFPIRVMDPLVAFLSIQYSTTGKAMIHDGVNTLNQTLAILSNVLNAVLNIATSQISSGVGSAIQLYNGLSKSAQTCVGDFPGEPAQRIINQVASCTRDRWSDLTGIVEKFRSMITDTDSDFESWLKVLGMCDSGNFANLQGADLETQQRRCYVKAISGPAAQILSDIPMRWANLTVHTQNVMTNFQPQIGLCLANIGSQIASIVTSTTLRSIMCQFMP